MTINSNYFLWLQNLNQYQHHDVQLQLLNHLPKFYSMQLKSVRENETNRFFFPQTLWPSQGQGHWNGIQWWRSMVPISMAEIKNLDEKFANYVHGKVFAMPYCSLARHDWLYRSIWYSYRSKTLLYFLSTQSIAMARNSEMLHTGNYDQFSVFLLEITVFHSNLSGHLFTFTRKYSHFFHSSLLSKITCETRLTQLNFFPTARIQAWALLAQLPMPYYYQAACTRSTALFSPECTNVCIGTLKISCFQMQTV